MGGSTAQGRAGGQGGFEPAPQTIDMGSTEELVEAIHRLSGLTPSQPDDRDYASPGRGESSTGGGDRSSQITSPPKPSVGVAGGAGGVFSATDTFTTTPFRASRGR